MPLNSSSKLSFRLQLIATANGADKQNLPALIGLPPTGPGSLLWNEHDQLLVYIWLRSTAPADLAALTETGAVITHVADSYRTVTAYINPAQLNRLAELDIIESIQEVLSP